MTFATFIHVVFSSQEFLKQSVLEMLLASFGLKSVDSQKHRVLETKTQTPFTS